MDDPTVGKWITEDPIGFKAGDGNLYRYVRNEPLVGIDPRGLQQTTPAHVLKGFEYLVAPTSDTLTPFGYVFKYMIVLERTSQPYLVAQKTTKDIVFLSGIGYDRYTHSIPR